jgi:16S rRNA A1518/A1519 N6-dimethyltransferase RsmA/KsgA/DIM1 with predicted DNA glycosylase/AP lyase activity
MPSSPRVRDALLQLIDPTTVGVIHELGAGWGTLVFAIARHCPKAQVVAHEGSIVPWLFLRTRAALSSSKNISVRFGNFMNADLTGASGAVAYLWTGGMRELGPKFEAELPPGAFVVSHTFEWRGRAAEAQVTARDLYRTPIYRYRL